MTIGPFIDIEGAVDVHVHSEPDLFPRIADDVGVARHAASLGLRALSLRCHSERTTSRAYMAMQQVPGIQVVGGIVLNRAVGGINPAAVEAALQLGGKHVWMPTVDAANHARTFGSTGAYDKQASSTASESSSTRGHTRSSATARYRRCGTTPRSPDLGAGQAASLANIAGEVLGVTVDRTAVHIGDSALTPLTGGTFATRQLYMSGNAVLNVARALREKLEPVAAALLERDVPDLRFEENRVWAAGRSITMGELSRAAEHQSVMPYHHDTFDAETGKFDAETGQGRSFPDCTHGAHAAEVEVDTTTGEVRILKYVAVHDIGRAINMRRVEGQIQGAVAQGVGYALSEEVEVSGGVVSSTLFADYLIPTSADLPDIKAIGLELHPGKGPFGARGIGEPPIGPPPAALASAIQDAVGIRLRRLPMTPERILAALREARVESPTASS